MRIRTSRAALPAAVEIEPFSPALAESAAAVVRGSIDPGWRAEFSAEYVERCVEYSTAASLARDALTQYAVVGVAGAQVVGYAAIEGEWLRGVFVEPGHRRTGIGRTLVAALERHARDSGTARLRLHAAPSAVPFYRSLGFEFTNCEERAYGSLAVCTKTLNRG